MKILRFVLFIIGCGLLLTANAQDKPPVKFGEVVANDFNLSGNQFDTSTSAVVIADIGSSSLEINLKGWFTLVYKRQKRVKILNRNGFRAANESITLYSDGQSEEKLGNLNASTYNMENGNVIETKLDDKSVFKETISANLIRNKFTLPGVKEGSIIEYSYTIHSDFLFNLQPWTFQGEYPCLWSEYQVFIPESFNYVFLSQGYLPYTVNTQSAEYKSFHFIYPTKIPTSHSAGATLSGNVINKRWVMKDIPALKEEMFTSTLKNHVAKVEFQLSQYRFPNMTEDILGNWTTAGEKLMKIEQFGAPIEKNNYWLDHDMKSIIGSAANDLEKAKKIFAYVRDNFTCTDHSEVYLSNPLKTIFNARNGSVTDINLLLIAMLRHEEIQVDPVLLSTRSHGFANEVYPLLDRFNYVIAVMTIQDKPYYLDASRPELGFAKLPLDCYNGVARIIGKEPRAVFFLTDSLEEKKTTSVYMINNDKGQMEGGFQSQLGYMESIDVRKKIRDKGKDEYLKNIRSSSGTEMHIEDLTVDSLKEFEKPVQVRYNFTMDKNSDDIIYFNPIMAQGYRENPFKAAERNYPVEMPCTMNETYVFNMEIPEHYTVDEVPKSAKVFFNENEGVFEYTVVRTATNVQLRSRIVLKKANFMPDEYNSLRDFFNYIVKKHSEQIVFKKKN